MICDTRFSLEHYHDRKGGSRSEFQRDFDRLVFSSPFRRLQNKTQVFPLPGSIFVHNRLTHSMEVACVGRSMARGVASVLKARHDGMPWADDLDAIGEIVAAACLAHDLGNPPFGHSGERAISSFFTEGPGRHLEQVLSPQEWSDLTHFDGNANAFRLLTHQFKGRRPGGFAMTYSTLASIVKYPYESVLSGAKSKFGFFSSEREAFVKVAQTLGLKRLSAEGEPLRYARHPLVYLVEAADDICYEIMDIEDAHKLGIIPTDVVIGRFLGFFCGLERVHAEKVMAHIDDPNEQIGYLRSIVIGKLVEECAEVFTGNEQALLEGGFDGSLIDHISDLPRAAYKECEALSWSEIYCSADVVDIELAGTSIISFLMEKLIHAVLNPTENYSKLLLAKVPGQYEVDSGSLSTKVMAAVDHVTAMTDVYALDLYRRLNGMSLKINN